MSDLYTDGWRQGGVVGGELSVSYFATADDGDHLVTQSFSRWIVCTQDCDLHNANVDTEDPLIELRPVLPADRPMDWGIKGRYFKITDDSWIDANAPRCLVTPAFLNRMASSREEVLDEKRRRYFKAWLGRRYGRPAVPESLVPLAREIAVKCSDRRGRDVSDKVHDVLMQFNEDADPVRVVLFGVVYESDDIDEVRVWLSDVATRIDTDLGVVFDVRVANRANTPLGLVEDSYSADLSQLTWSRRKPT